MLQRLLNQLYGIHIQEEFNHGPYSACQDQNNLYLLIPIGAMEEDNVTELERLTSHLKQYGDASVCQFLKSKDGKNIVEWEQSRYCVLAKASAETRPLKRLGRKLAKFHYRGRAVPFEIRNINRIGMWKTFWEQRLNQMENVWNGQIMQSPENDFERMFIESFPYYMGLTENALQYLSDTELDDQPALVDSGTVCHERFSAQTWGESLTMKNPFDWVFDHCARDLAEWTRERYFHNIKTYEPAVRQFYQDYATISTLSSFSWRLVYARLLFPLHYFECIEDYYITDSEQHRHVLEERLKKYLDQTGEHEGFLRDFFPLAEVPTRRYQIPEIEWLKR